MKKKIYISIFFVLAIILIAVFFVNKKVQAPEVSSQLSADSLQESNTNTQNTKNNNQSASSADEQVQQVQQKTIEPIDGAKARITKKPFGIFISKQNSPVSPERFSGYHAGIDLEITPEEQNIDVQVLALCEGKLLAVRNASGYGGVAVQSCILDEQVVTVIYGHIELASMSAKVGDVLKAGDFLANLGDAYSSETDGERKHLHLGIHKGTSINILGYVGLQSELSAWKDPTKYLK